MYNYFTWFVSRNIDVCIQYNYKDHLNTVIVVLFRMKRRVSRSYLKFDTFSLNSLGIKE